MTRTEHDDDRLPEPAEGWLKGWPAPSRSSLEWEDAASAIMARVREVEVEVKVESGSTSDELLAAPLPAEEGERTFDLDLPADEPSLAAIARKVVESGAALPTDLAKEGLLAAAKGRAALPLEAPPRSRSGMPRRSGPAAPAEGSAGPHAPLPTQPRPLSAMHVASARSELPYSQVPSAESGRSPSSRQGLAGIYLGGAALAVAAAALVLVLVRQPELAAPPSLASAEHDRRPAAPPDQPVAPPRAAADMPVPRQLDDLLPAEPQVGKEATEARRAAPPKGASNATPTDSLPFRVQPSPKSKVVLSSRDETEGAAETEPKPEEKAQAGAPGAAPDPSLAQAVAPPAEPAGKEALPERPSIGAVQGAVGSVMMGARSCLAGQDEGSRAQITFGPDGRVRSVAVSGPAAGTPAESCLRSALSAARVAPFSEPTFTASLTVRPP